MRVDRIRFVAEITKRDLTQKKLAEISGVSRATVNSIKNGKTCSKVVAEKIAKALNIPLGELCIQTEDKKTWLDCLQRGENDETNV